MYKLDKSKLLQRHKSSPHLSYVYKTKSRKLLWRQCSVARFPRIDSKILRLQRLGERKQRQIVIRLFRSTGRYCGGVSWSTLEITWFVTCVQHPCSRARAWTIVVPIPKLSCTLKAATNFTSWVSIHLSINLLTDQSSHGSS